jgi:hypothetical protein
MREREREREE